MPNPADDIPQDLRDRLDAAREHFHIVHRRHDAGDPELHGRVGPVWSVWIGPDGWQRDPMLGPDRPREKGYPAAPDPGANDGPLIAQNGRGLAAALIQALEAAEARWPP